MGAISIDAADAAAKQARTVGLLTEEITALNYAAELSGVNQEELTGALVRLSRTASDADKGVKAAESPSDWASRCAARTARSRAAASC